MEKNKVTEDNWVRPKYLPMPEFEPTDLSTIDFSKYFEREPNSEIKPTVKFNITKGSMSMFQISHGGV